MSSSIIRRMSMETYMVRIYTGPLSQECDFTSIEAEKTTPAIELIRFAVKKLKLGNADNYELAEVFCSAGQLCKERRLDPTETPVRIQLLWPKVINAEQDSMKGLLTGYRYYIRKKDLENAHRMSWHIYTESNPVDSFLTAFLKQPTSNKEYSDLCNLPELNERTLLQNIKFRFTNNNIYTYVGSILIAVNPFKFFPIYNPKYVKMYQNKRLGELPPHIFAIADAAFHTMLRTKKNQCIVISGESGSGKTESTNLLLHHLTALSHKGLHGSGVEQTILGAGPVLEAFGNAKTVHNNNSSRFGKFLQVNYKENGMVHGAIVEKYLLEKSRIVSQAKNERNYHVFYYMLAGADEAEQSDMCLSSPESYYYLRQSDCHALEEVDEVHEFARLKQSMEMVGFSHVTQRRIFCVLSAVLQIGNVEFRKKGDQHHDESVAIKNLESIKIISKLLKVEEKTLIDVLTQKKTTAGDETVVMNYKMGDAIATRDAIAKCLYGALFDWIVLKVNQALLAKRHNSEHQGNSIGVLDIFGFEDFQRNSFEQFCINYANEHLQYYFNQHIFKFEQEEYKKEGIQWKNIEFIDNTDCLELFSKKPHGLLSQLDEECNYPGGSSSTLLVKYNHLHSSNPYYEKPQLREEAFVIFHYAGRVKYQISDFKEKNSDLMRSNIVGVVKSSSLSFVRELMGLDPVAVLRWSIMRALVRSVFAFIAAGKKYRKDGAGTFSCELFLLLCLLSMIFVEVSLSFLYLSKEGCYTRKASPLTHCMASTSIVISVAPRLPSCDDNDVDGDDEADDLQSKPNDLVTEEYLSSPVESFLPEADARVIRRAKKIMMKNKSFKSKSKPPAIYRDIKTLKQIASRMMYSGGKSSSKKQSPSVGAQFQWSLSKLMYTLNQANPFFIRCIKSNADKMSCYFDDVLVLRQLRYTGMLATVRIRQSGYNYRLSFEEFIQTYKILLPKGLLSSQEDVTLFLQKMDLRCDNYQIGTNKVFLREGEKMILDDQLHCAIMERVIRIQRWFKTILECKIFRKMKWASLVLQCHIRRFIAQRQLRQLIQEREAALSIQKWYRSAHQQKAYKKALESVQTIQALCKGFLCRKKYRKLIDESVQRRQEEKLRHKQAEDIQSSTSDEGVLTKGSSAEELETDVRVCCHVSCVVWQHMQAVHNIWMLECLHSSKAIKKAHVMVCISPTEDTTAMLRLAPERLSLSSGIHEDSESDTHSLEPPGRGGLAITPPLSPSSPGPTIRIQHVPSKSEESLVQLKKLRSLYMHACYFKEVDSGQQYIGLKTAGGSYFIRRGSQRRKPLPNVAPLAKQESFSDLGGEKNSEAVPLSPDRIQIIDEQFKKNRDLRKADIDSTADQHKSPFHRAKKHIKNFVGDTSVGVPVLPQYPEPNSPKSPTGERQERRRASVDDIIAPPIAERNRKKRTSHKRGGLTEWNVSGASVWQYPAELVANDMQELQELDKFVYVKLIELSKDGGKKDTIFDVVFKSSLCEFNQEMKNVISLEMQVIITKTAVSVPYRDLMSSFEQILSDKLKKEGSTNASFPVTLGINAFRGFLDEFMKKHHGDKKKKEERKIEGRAHKRDKQKKDTFEIMGHKFTQVQFGIPTFCEYCSNLIWIMEKGSVCQVCKFTCHKKCTPKSNTPCKGTHDSQTSGPKQVFGAALSSLIKEGEKYPEVVEKLISAIEIHGMYTVGLYRKSGSAQKARQLKQLIDSSKDDLKSLDLESYPIHVLTTTLKSFLREMPEPLLTFELYDDILRVAEIKDDHERVPALFGTIDRLPKINHDLFERLIFHLTRVAVHESSNKMSVNSLAIIFAPCLLRTNKKIQAQESLKHVPRQTLAVECILSEKLNKNRDQLEDIQTLEKAEATATDRLSFVRASIRTSKSPDQKAEPVDLLPPPEVETAVEEERALCRHIQSIKKEKTVLTSRLPLIECRQYSSDDEILSTDDMDSTYDTPDDQEDNQDEYAITFAHPVSPPANLKHLTKRRASLPEKRMPKKYRFSIERQMSGSSESLSDSVDEPVILETLELPNQNSEVTRTPSYDLNFVSAPGLQNIEEDEIMV
ncbi:hypothetical protein ScPMuIL_017612 [Solemya velum]